MRLTIPPILILAWAFCVLLTAATPGHYREQRHLFLQRARRGAHGVQYGTDEHCGRGHGGDGEGETDGALTSTTYRGLYTSTDAGQTWTYNALFSGASEATSATSVVYNGTAGLFFAAERYHGFYSSPDGLTWTRLANQPGAGVLSAAACPQNYSTSCPIYWGEITVVPGRNEMYVWFLSLTSTGGLADQGIWQSENGGASWTQINDRGIINCGDGAGCGVQQGFYNLELLTVPNGSSATDLYAGAINLYKCSINASNPTCSSTLFLNLTQGNRDHADGYGEHSKLRGAAAIEPLQRHPDGWLIHRDCLRRPCCCR